MIFSAFCTFSLRFFEPNQIKSFLYVFKFRAADSPAGPVPIIIPVSYTHLDVYKRQLRTIINVYWLDDPNKPFWDYSSDSLGAWFGIFTILFPWIGAIPVSYTHLDVYKRQLYSLKSLYIDSCRGKKCLSKCSAKLLMICI